MATQNESILALLRPTETKLVPKWPIESLFDSILLSWCGEDIFADDDGLFVRFVMHFKPGKNT